MIELCCQIGDVKIMNDMVKLVGEVCGKEYFDMFCGQIVIFIECEVIFLE